MSIENKNKYPLISIQYNSCISQNYLVYSSTEQHVHIHLSVFSHSATVKHIFSYSIFSQVPPVVPLSTPRGTRTPS